jgi:hypothetical protein
MKNFAFAPFCSIFTVEGAGFGIRALLFFNFVFHVDVGLARIDTSDSVFSGDGDLAVTLGLALRTYLVAKRTSSEKFASSAPPETSDTEFVSAAYLAFDLPDTLISGLDTAHEDERDAGRV